MRLVVTLLTLTVFLSTHPVLRGLDGNKAPNQYVHDQWKSGNGLPSNGIPALYQSKSGYLWLGTFDEGLVRFDGVRFVNYGHTTTELSALGIVALTEDLSGTMIVGTQSQGLFQFNGTTFSSLAPYKNAGKLSRSINKLWTDASGAVWVGTSTGVLRIFQSKLDIILKVNEITQGYKYSFCQTPDGTVWIGATDGLYTYSSGKAVRAGQFPAVPVAGLCSDKAGNVWVSASDNVVRLSGGNSSTATLIGRFSGNPVQQLLSDRDGTLWIATAHGLSRYSNGVLADFTAEELADDPVISLLEDREGSVWIGTFTGGLHRLRDAVFTTLTTKEGLSGDYIRSIIETKDGLWVATSQGLSRMNGTVSTTYNSNNGLSSDNPITALYEARDGTLWIGGSSGSVDKYSNGKFTSVPFGSKSQNDIAYSFHEDKKGTLWIGTSNGIMIVVDNAIMRTEPKSGGLLPGIIAGMLEDKQGRLWISCYGGGVSCYSNGRFTSYTVQNGLPSNQIRCMYEDKSGALWFGSHRDGLTRLLDGKFTTITSQDGLFDNRVYSITEDASGNFWISSNKGVYRIVKRDIEHVMNGTAKKVVPVVYREQDGMKSAECTVGFMPAAWQTKDGRICFPTVHGMAVVRTGKMSNNTLLPNVVIEQITADSISFAPADTLLFPAGTNQIEFTYTALSLLIPSNVQFKYRILENSSNWIDAGNRRTAYYTSLPPGKYTFQVIACNNDGVWNETGARISFTVSPFFYQTWWFRIMAILALAGAGFAVYHLRVRSLVARKAELEVTVQERTKEISIANASLAQVNHELANTLIEMDELNRNLKQLNEDKTEVLGIVAHDLKNPIAGIALTASNVKNYFTMLPPDEVKSMMEKIETTAGRMRDIIINLLDVNAIESGKVNLNVVKMDASALATSIVRDFMERASAKNIRLKLTLPPKETLMLADQSAIHEILDNLVSNAIKFSPGDKTVEVSVAQVHSMVRLEVRDEGPGMSAEDKKKLFGRYVRLSAKPTGGEHSSGLGLSIVKKLVEVMNGQVWCESEIGKGATFIVELPAAVFIQ
ncbi:MAG: two-component regulator propeller domain-containing protein [Candidatus Kapaibacterium sp.]